MVCLLEDGATKSELTSLRSFSYCASELLYALMTDWADGPEGSPTKPTDNDGRAVPRGR